MAPWREQFDQTGALRDLAALVRAMEEKRDWDGVCEYGAKMFDLTQSFDDAARLIFALQEVNRHDEVVRFYEAHDEIFEQSKDVQIAVAWAYYYEGKFGVVRERFSLN